MQKLTVDADGNGDEVVNKIERVECSHFLSSSEVLHTHKDVLSKRVNSKVIRERFRNNKHFSSLFRISAQRYLYSATPK